MSLWPDICFRPKGTAWPCTPQSKFAIRSWMRTSLPFWPDCIRSWKLRGFRDKHLLRLLAERWLPPSVYRRSKVIFRAPLDSFHIDPEPAFVGQLLSEESLKRTGYFDVSAVRHWRRAFRQMRPNSLPRMSVEMGLVAVVGTQLWHHLYIDGNLADLPTWSELSARSRGIGQS